MSTGLDRLLTRLWVSLTAFGLIAATLHLGAVVGLRRWPSLGEGAVGSTSAAPAGGRIPDTRLGERERLCIPVMRDGTAASLGRNDPHRADPR